jgi:hypothetical protein
LKRQVLRREDTLNDNSCFMVTEGKKWINLI